MGADQFAVEGIFATGLQTAIASPIDQTATPADNDVLIYDAATGKWGPEALPASGVTAVSVTAPITDTGTATHPNIGLSTPLSVANGGTGSSTGARLNPAPTAAGKIPYDNGTTYSETAAGTSVQVLHGGATPSFGAVALASEVSGTLPVANGGTNSAAALANNKAMISSGGAIVESAVTSTELSYSSGVTSAIQTQFSNKQAIYWGDGSDGVVLLDGTNTFSWASKSGSTYTMTRSVFATTITVANTAILKTSNAAVYASTSITVQNGGTISNNGGNASGSSAGGLVSAKFYAGSSSGGAGGSGAGSVGGGSSTAGLGGVGGAGGIGSAGAAGSGGASALTDTVAYNTPFGREFGWAGPNIGGIKGGAGGGSGGGQGLGVSGGGGGGGGYMMLKSPTITVASGGTVQANGGNGGNGDSGAGGGGGGGGGVISLIYQTYSNSGTVQVSGGTKGTGGGSGGADGVNGSAGVVLQLLIV